MALGHRLAGVFALLGALATGAIAVRGWLALRELPNPPQLAAQDIALQVAVVALPLVGAYLVVVRRSAVGVAMLAALAALELPLLGRDLVHVTREAVYGEELLHALGLGESAFLVAAGTAAWLGGHSRIRDVRSRIQPVLWVAAAAVAVQGVFSTIALRLPGSDVVRPVWYEPQLLRMSAAERVVPLATVLLVVIVVAVAAGWPRDVAAGALMVVALPTLLSEFATLTRALREEELTPTVWGWVVAAGAGIMVLLALRWWNTVDEADRRRRPPLPRLAASDER